MGIDTKLGSPWEDRIRYDKQCVGLKFVSTHSSLEMDRRHYLVGLSGATGMCFSGCLGFGSEDVEREDLGSSTTPPGVEHTIPELNVRYHQGPHPEIVDIVIQEGPTVGKRATVDVAIGNLGNATVEEAQIELNANHISEKFSTETHAISVSDVPSLEWVSKRIELEFETSGEWTIQSSVDGDWRVNPIDVESVTAPRGEPVTVYDDVSIRLLEARTEQCLFYGPSRGTDSDRDNTLGPGVEMARDYVTPHRGPAVAYVLSHFELEATGESEVRIGKLGGIANPDYRFSPSPQHLHNSAPGRSAFHLDGELLEGVALDPGETADFWSLTCVSEDELESGLVGFSLYDGSKQVPDWDYDNPDILVSNELPRVGQLAKFVLQDYSIVAQDSESPTVQMNVANAGGSPATFRAAIEIDNTKEIFYPDTAKGEIQPGAGKQFSIELPADAEDGSIEPFGPYFNI